MTLRLTLISTECEDFALEFKIDADDTFEDLHRLILRHCDYEEIAGQRFFICDENWKPNQRILLKDETRVDINEDVFLMHDTSLGEFLEDEGQHIAYRFDPENRRMFLLELTETSFGDMVPKGGKLTRHVGLPPTQNIQKEDNNISNPTMESEELASEFYGEDGFNEDDMDEEGFDIIE